MDIEVIVNYAVNANGEIEEVLPGFNAAYKQAGYLQMTELCGRSVKKSLPNSKLILFTNQKLEENCASFDHVYYDNIRLTHFEYDQLCFRIDYLKQKIGWDGVLVFTDIDVLFNKNIIENIDFAEDVYLGISPDNNKNLNPEGLPDEHLMYNTTTGIYICKPTERAISFFEMIKQKIESDYSSSNYDSYKKSADRVKDDFFKWWCILHSLSLYLGKEILSGHHKNLRTSKFNLGFIDERFFNYAPNIINAESARKIDIKEIDYQNVKMFHFRGLRKVFMSEVAQKIGLI